MTSTTKYIVLSTAGDNRNFIDFELSYGTLTLDGEQVQFIGSARIDALFVRPGITFDLASTGLGADKIYLGGAWGDYSRAYSGTQLTLTRTVGAKTETVKVSAGASTATDALVFADGTVSAYEAYAYTKGTQTSVPTPAGETSAAPAAPAASGSALSATVKAVAFNSAGDTIALAKPGMNFTVVGSAGVDKVYVAEGSTADASGTGVGTDIIYFRGSFSEYTKAVSGTKLIFTRTINGNLEKVTVAAGSGHSNDQLVFRDGAVLSNNARTALTGNLNAAITAVTGYDATTTTPGAGASIFAVSNDDRIDPGEGAAGVIVSGAGDIGAAIRLVAGPLGTDGIYPIDRTAIVGPGRTWSITLTPSELAKLADGGQTLTVTSTLNGTAQGSAQRLVTLDLTVDGERVSLFTISPGGSEASSAKASLVMAAASDNTLVPSGIAGNDTVFVDAGANVDLNGLGAGAGDTIYLPARWSDYNVTVSGLTLVFTRNVTIDGETVVERIVVGAGNGDANNDRLVFADGASVNSYLARLAMNGLQSGGWNSTVAGIDGYRVDAVPNGVEARVSSSNGAILSGRVIVPTVGDADYAAKLVTKVTVTFNGVTREVTPDTYGSWTASFTGAEMPGTNGMVGIQIVAKNAAAATLYSASEQIFAIVDSTALALVDLSFSAQTVQENAAGVTAGTLTPSPGTQTFTTTDFAVDDTRFEVAEVGGAFVLRLKTGQSLDYETAASVAVKVSVTGDDGRVAAKLFTVAVADVNDAPQANTGVVIDRTIGTDASGVILNLADADPVAGAQPAFTDADAAGSANGTLNYSGQLITNLGTDNAVGGTGSNADTYGALPTWLEVTSAGVVQVVAGQAPVTGIHHLHLTASDGAQATAVRDMTLTVSAGITLSDAGMQGKSNLDLRTDAVLFAAQDVNLVGKTSAAGMTIKLVNLTTPGRDIVLDLANDTDRGMVSITHGSTHTTIVINPAYDLQAGAQYRVEVSSGAFVATGGGSSSLALDATNGIVFNTVALSTVAAGAQITADLLQAPDAATGAISWGQVDWHNLVGHGSRGTEANSFASTKAAAIDAAVGAHVFYLGAITDAGNRLFTTTTDAWAQVNNFGKDDRLYFDDQVNNASTYGQYNVMNSVGLTTYDEGNNGVDGNRVTFPVSPGPTSGLWLDMTLDTGAGHWASQSQNYASSWSGTAEPTFQSVYAVVPVLIA